jgi:hypothetical protein
MKSVGLVSLNNAGARVGAPQSRRAAHLAFAVATQIASLANSMFTKSLAFSQHADIV